MKSSQDSVIVPVDNETIIRFHIQLFTHLMPIKNWQKKSESFKRIIRFFYFATLFKHYMLKIGNG